MISTIVSTISSALTEPWSVPASLFYMRDGASVGALSIDLILEEQHSIQADVSTHPIQDGSEVTDHIVQHLREGSLRALVSNFDVLRASNKGKTIFSEDGNFLTRYTELRTYKGDPPDNRAAEAWTELKAIVASGKPVRIVTSLETYDNVVVTNVSTMRDGDSGESLEFDITFKQIKVVHLQEDSVTEAVGDRDMTNSLSRSSVSEQAAGQKVAADATQEQQQAFVDSGNIDAP